MLSVFLNLDPTEFATPSARSSAITSVMTAAAHKVDEKSDLTHEERMALRDDVERVRDVLLARTSRPTAPAPWPCTHADPPSCSRSSASAGRSTNKVVLDRTAFVEPLVLHGTDEQWLVIITNRRAARIFVGPGDALEETDRIVDDVHSKHEKGGWSQSNYQRSVEKEVQDHLANAAELAFSVYKKREPGPRPGRRARTSCCAEFKGKLHPYLRERIVGRDRASTSRTPRSTTSAPPRGR